LIQLDHNANPSDVDSFSTRSNGTKGEPQWIGEGNCNSKNSIIGYKSTVVVESGSYIGIFLGSHPWARIDIQCLRYHGCEGMGPHLGHNLS
jgi:hypothetical protein